VSKMEKGVSVEQQIKHAEDWNRRHYALEEECEDCLAILSSLRELVLLREVAKAARVFHNEWAEDAGAAFHTAPVVRRSAGDLFLRLQALDAALAAYEARPK
jgi:hypothetical protein